MMRIKSRLMAAAALIILAHCVCANATVLNFDDLSDGAHLAALSTYAGFDWNPDYIYAESMGNLYGRSSVDPPFPSGSIAVYNGYGVSVATISSTTNFDFVGAYFASWTSDLTPATQIELRGYNNGTPVGPVVQFNLTEYFQWVEADISNINKLEIVRTSPETAAWWLMDNFTYEAANTSAVPEPTTMFLLGLGLVGIAGFRKRMN